MTFPESPDSESYVYIDTPTTSSSPTERDSILEVDELDAILTPTLSLSEAEAEDESEDEVRSPWKSIMHHRSNSYLDAAIDLGRI
jgi:hypothetical protein